MALIEKVPHGLRISATNTAARNAGIMVGAALADARAVLPSLVVKPAQSERDREALVALAGWLGRYGPFFNLDGADGAWVDTTGVAHLFGGEERLCADLSDRLGKLDLTVHVGLADTLGAARALARFGSFLEETRWTIADPGGTKAALAGLPVAALGLAPATVQLLIRLGLKRIGQLYGLPRAALAARFRGSGKPTPRGIADTTAAALLMRLDQALGITSEPLRPLIPRPAALSRLAFSEPLLTTDGIECALDRLLQMLANNLAEQCLGARQFRFALYRTDGTIAHTTVSTSSPRREPVHIRRLMMERMHNLDAGFGIDVATLEANHLEPHDDYQTGFSDTVRGPAEEPGALVDRLVSRLGRLRVSVWSGHASHIPEQAESWLPAMDQAAKIRIPGTEESRTGVVRGKGGFARAPSPPARTTSPPRPPFLLSPPEPISVIAEVPDGAPQRFVWRRLARRIVRSEGPERIAAEWWLQIHIGGRPPGTRDYYRLEDATGARYWIFREGLYSGGDDSLDSPSSTSRTTGPCWFIHGLFP
jgi:protein ImuB